MSFQKEKLEQGTAAWMSAPESEAFAIYFFDQSIQITRVAWLLSAGLFVVFYFLDGLMLEAGREATFAIRFYLAVPLSCAFFLLTYAPFYRRHAQALLATGVSGIGLVVLWLVALPQPGEPAFRFYPFAVTLYILNIFILSRLRFQVALLVAGLILFGFFVVELEAKRALEQPDYIPVFFSQVLLLVSAAAIGVFSGYYVEHFMGRDFHQKRLLSRVNAENQTLLNSILPETISRQIKAGRSPVAQNVPEASCLFSDLAGFTRFSRDLPPDVVVAYLNRLYAGFDELCSRYGVEKIKTIGDAYMAVAGLPEANAQHAPSMARFAVGIRELFHEIEAEEKTGLGLRIGIHSGPVVAGVIGKRKFSYDVWGDTVNTASRLESSSPRDGIHVSSAFAQRLGGEFSLENLGEISLKGIGSVQTFLLEPVRAKD